MRTLLTLLCFGAFLAGTSTASAQWWWPFGTRPSSAPPAEQSTLAAPIYEEAVALRERGKIDSAGDKFEYIFKRYPLATIASEATFAYSEIEIEEGDWEEAFEGLQRLLTYYPQFPRFDDVIAMQFQIALAMAEGRGVRTFYIFPSRNYNRAVAYFMAVVANAPYSELAPLALMNIASIEQSRGNVGPAVDALDQLINEYPSTLLADDAYLLLAETFANLVDGPLYDQGATREAISYFQDYLILYPQDEAVAQGEEGLADMQDVYAASKLLIGEYYLLHRRNFEAAEIFLNEAITIAPNSPSAERARERLVLVEDVLARLEADPDYQVPALTMRDYLLFWRKRELEKPPEPLPDPDEINMSSGPAPGPAATTEGPE